MLVKTVHPRTELQRVGENGIKWGSHRLQSHYFGNRQKSLNFPALSLLFGCCSRLSGYLSSTPIWLIVLDRKRLIVIAVLSVLISRVKPLSGHASVHVVKAIYEQWPDMKPRLLRSCKQPHLFEPTCSPVFTSLVNNEISPAYYYYCIRNITAAWTSTLSKKKKHAWPHCMVFKLFFFSLSSSVHSFIQPLIHSFLSLFIYISPWVFVFILVPWTLPPHVWHLGCERRRRGELVQNDHYH